jgi:hypothetical protein
VAEAFKVSLSLLKQNFFNREMVQRVVRSDARKAFTKFGAYTMRRARKSLRNVPKKRNRAGSISKRYQRFTLEHGESSRPGEPPFSRTGTLKRFILFAYDPGSDSVVIGPARVSGRNAEGLNGQTVPQVLEHGGRVRFFEVFKYGGWRRADFRRRETSRLPMRQRVVTYAARPYMRPAFLDTARRLPDIWARAVSRAAA